MELMNCYTRVVGDSVFKCGYKLIFSKLREIGVGEDCSEHDYHNCCRDVCVPVVQGYWLSL